MRIFTTEIKKLFLHKIFLLMVATVLVMNGYLMLQGANTKAAMLSDYQMIFSELENKSDQEKLEYFDERINHSAEGIYDYNWKVFYELANECYDIVHYQDFLDSIEEQKKSMTAVSIFAKPDTFNYRSIAKTPDAYQKLRDVVPVFDVSKGIEHALDNSFSDILCGVIMFLAVFVLMISDREIGISGLLFSLRRGRGCLMYIKLAVLFLILFLTVFIIYSENLLIASFQYGLGDILRPIQSLRGFLGCNLKISIAEYLVIYILFKLFALFSIGVIISFIAIAVKNSISFYGISAVILIVEGILYKMIHPLSIYSIFRHINLIGFTRVNDIFCEYNNINFWEYPIPLIPTSLIAVLLFCVAGTISSAVLYAGKRNLVFYKIGWKLKIGRKNKIHSAIYYTFYKSLIQQKGIWVLLTFFLAICVMNTCLVKKYDIQDVYYKYYAEQLEGKIDDSTERFMQKEEKRFLELKEQLEELKLDSVGFSSEADELEKQLAPEMGFVLMKERYEKIKHTKDAQLFYDTGYKRMFGKSNYNDEVKNALLSIVFCIFLISPLVASDNSYRMKSIIFSTSSGRGEYNKRNIIAALIYGLISTVIWGVSYAVRIHQLYGFPGIHSSLQSISDFVGFPIHFTVLQVMVLIAIFRGIFMGVASLIMLWISFKSKSAAKAELISFVLFVIPMIIYLFSHR